MSAPSRPHLRPAEQVASSLEQGRKLILQVVCGGYLLYLLLLHLLLPVLQLSPVGPELLTGYLCLATLLLSLLPTIQFSLLISLLALVYPPYMVAQILMGMERQLLPVGFLAWTPLVLVLCFALLGWRLGSVVGGVLTGAVFLSLWLSPPVNPEHLSAWLSQGMVMVVLDVVCALIARSVEQRLLVGEEASLQLAAARMDILTGLMGRAASELYLNEGLELSEQEKVPLSLLICDLDNFKSVNDRYGHPVGDAVLKAAARRLKRQVGNSGQVGRWGGEEFVAILPGIAKNEALVLAERMRRAVAGNDLAGLSVTASFGVAAYRTGETVAELFERADQRLYEAKNGGRNTVRG